MSDETTSNPADITFDRLREFRDLGAPSRRGMTPEDRARALDKSIDEANARVYVAQTGGDNPERLFQAEADARHRHADANRSPSLAELAAQAPAAMAEAKRAQKAHADAVSALASRRKAVADAETALERATGVHAKSHAEVVSQDAALSLAARAAARGEKGADPDGAARMLDEAKRSRAVAERVVGESQKALEEGRAAVRDQEDAVLTAERAHAFAELARLRAAAGAAAVPLVERLRAEVAPLVAEYNAAVAHARQIHVGQHGADIAPERLDAKRILTAALVAALRGE